MKENPTQLLQKIKSFLSKASLPSETQVLLTKVKDTYQLRLNLDNIIRQNETNLVDIQKEITYLESEESFSKGKIKEGNLLPRKKDNLLRNIQRLRTRSESCQRRYKIYQENIDLHLQILDKISEMEAIELGILKKEDQIRDLVVDYEVQIEDHQKTVETGRAAFPELGSKNQDDAKEQRELKELEDEILKEIPSPETKTDYFPK